MKSIAIIMLINACTCALSQPYRVVGLQSQRQEAEPTADPERREQTTPRSEVPYPPSGWRPSVPRFILPARLLAPTQAFAVPSNTFGTPDVEYGAPSTSAASAETTNYDDVTQENTNVETLTAEDLNEMEQNNEARDDIESKVGAYYILLPDSTLQRVDYRTENDNRNMAYTARLQYRNEQPAQIYLYSSQQYIQLA